MTDIPQFEFFAVDGPEMAFGCGHERYLQIDKSEANDICRALPEEAKMADLLFCQGHLGEEQFGMAGREYAIEASPEEVRKTTAALIRSFAPSHEVKRATVAVALHRWFPRDTDTDAKRQDRDGLGPEGMVAGAEGIAHD